MIPAWIIDELTRRQEERRREEERQRERLELPFSRPPFQPTPEDEEEEPSKGPIVIEF